MGLNLLEKTELWVNEITLDGTNLTDLANAVAHAMGMQDGEVLVVDVRPRHITFDILARDIPQENILGKETAILDAIRAVPGVTLYPETYLRKYGRTHLLRCCGNTTVATQKSSTSATRSSTTGN